MKNATATMLELAHKAICAGTAIGAVTTEEWAKANLGVEGDKLNYSQTWRYHTYTMLNNAKAKCQHCVPERDDNLRALCQQVEDGVDGAHAKVALAITKLSAEGKSWGYISVCCGNDGTANAPWAESKVRSTFSATANIQHKGLRPAHKGGRWIAKREDLYREEWGLGTQADGVLRKPGDPLPGSATHPSQKTEEQKELEAKALKAKKAAHQRTLSRLAAEYAKLIKG